MGKLFEIGQAITPEREGQWSDARTGQPLRKSPKFGEIYHVGAHDVEINGLWMIFLVEIGATCSYAEKGFVPVISDGELGELLEGVSKDLQEA